MASKHLDINLCIDKGNSRTKIAVFDFDTLIYEAVLEDDKIEAIDKIIGSFKPTACILSDVGVRDADFELYLQLKFKSFYLFNSDTLIPVQNNYYQPETLGKDRLAAVIGAVALKPDSDLLVVDAGTAITFDFVNANGEYLGGNIAPGATMRAKALHNFTGRLPEVELTSEFDLLGKKTTTAIQFGIMNGIVFEINGYFEALKFKYPELSIFLTGGNANYFVSKLKSPIFVEKNLVLIGLNRILKFNVKK